FDDTWLIDVDAVRVRREVQETTDIGTQAAADVEDTSALQRDVAPDHLQTPLLPESPDVAWIAQNHLIEVRRRRGTIRQTLLPSTTANHGSRGAVDSGCPAWGSMHRRRRYRTLIARVARAKSCTSLESFHGTYSR